MNLEILNNISEGSILWKIVRGYNQRRNIGAKSYRKYEGTTWSDASNLEDSGIKSGAVIQHINFWRELQDFQNYVGVSYTDSDWLEKSFSYVRPPINGDDYAGQKPILELTATPQKYHYIDGQSLWSDSDLMNQPSFRRMTEIGETQYGLMEAGDILGQWVIDDLLRFLRLLQWVNRFNGFLNSYTANGFGFGSGGLNVPCSTMVANGKSQWNLNTNIIYRTGDGSDYTGFTVGAVGFNTFAFEMNASLAIDTNIRITAGVRAVRKVKHWVHGELKPTWTKVYTSHINPRGDLSTFYSPSGRTFGELFQIADHTNNPHQSGTQIETSLVEHFPLDSAYPLEVFGINCNNLGTRDLACGGVLFVSKYPFEDLTI